MKEVLNKRGIFFTGLVIVILSLFLISYTFYSLALDRKTVQKRIESMNSFLFAIEEDLSRQIYISGFRIIFLMEKRILEKGSGQYIENVNATFKEAFFNGTIEGYTDGEIEQLMEGFVFSNLTGAINDRAKGLNIFVNFSNPNIEVFHEDPWHVSILFSSNLRVEDLSGLASWNITQNVKVKLPIENFDDPIYPKESNQIESVVKIKKSPYEDFSNAGQIIEHANNTYYLNNSGAPSFLDRLEGNLSGNSSYGIESLVVYKLDELVSGRSVVDYQYFRGMSGIQCSGISWLYVDSEDNHQEIYCI